MRLAAKVAIITGGARGIGAATAEAFVRHGASVVIADLLDEGNALADQLGPSATFIRHDVTNPESWSNCVSEASDRFGLVNVLVNNAGILIVADLISTTTDQMRASFDVNLLGPMLGMQHLIAPMEDAGGGSIVNVSSIAGMQGMRNLSAYCASKWALRGLTKTAALELGARNIRVNSVHPGAIVTNMNPSGRSGLSSPLGREGRPDEVAELIVYLASDESSFTSGAEHVIDAAATAG